MWHLRKSLPIRCYKNPDRKQAYSAEIASGSKGSNTDSSVVAQRMQYRNDEAPNRGRRFNRGRGAGRGLIRGRGKSDGTSRCARHLMSFCKTEVNRESDDGIGSIYQNKVDGSLNSDSKDKEGVCYFLKSRLPTAQGMVNGNKIIALRWICYPKKFRI